MLHAGLLYSNTQQFLASAVPYISEGLDRDESVLAVTTNRNMEALRDSLGERAEAITFVDSWDWYKVQAHVLTRFMEHEAQRASGRAIRVLSEPLTAQWDDVRSSRWLTMEQVANVSLAGHPVSMVCPHDISSKPHLERDLSAAHPSIMIDGAMYDNPRFVEPELFYQRTYTDPAVPPNTETFPFTGRDLAAVRRQIDQCAANFAMDKSVRLDFVIAASEGMGNTVEHAGGKGMLRLWASDDELVCDIVSYEGRIDSPLTQGFSSVDLSSERGRGLWLIRKLCDWVEIYSPSRGSVVRLHLSLHEAEHPDAPDGIAKAAS